MTMWNRYARWLTATALASAIQLGCGGGPAANPDQPFGETAIVVVLNPRVNDGNTASPPASVGAARSGVVVDAEPGGQTTTDATGLGVITGLTTGNIRLLLPGGSSVPINIAASGDVYDIAVGYNGTVAPVFPNFPIRYEVGGQIVRFDTTASPMDVRAALSTRDNIVFFRNGTYSGDVTIEGDNVIFFGEGFTERRVIINGSLVVRGTGVRIRGFTITGDVTVNGNNFGMSFSVVRGRTDIRGNGVAFLRNAFCGSVSVPSSNAALLDNKGMAPLPPPPSALCQ
jgi:hypothetical protein